MLYPRAHYEQYGIPPILLQEPSAHPGMHYSEPIIWHPVLSAISSNPSSHDTQVVVSFELRSMSIFLYTHFSRVVPEGLVSHSNVTESSAPETAATDLTITGKAALAHRQCFSCPITADSVTSVPPHVTHSPVRSILA
jgi:hypothetical protein